MKRQLTTRKFTAFQYNLLFRTMKAGASDEVRPYSCMDVFVNAIVAFISEQLSLHVTTPPVPMMDCPEALRNSEEPDSKLTADCVTPQLIATTAIT